LLRNFRGSNPPQNSTQRGKAEPWDEAEDDSEQAREGMSQQLPKAGRQARLHKHLSHSLCDKQAPWAAPQQAGITWRT